MSIQAMVAGILTKALPAAVGSLGLDEQAVEKLLEIPKDPTHGQVAFPCYVFAKTLGKSPAEIASLLASQLGSVDVFEKAEAIGPYLNIHLSSEILASSLVTWAGGEFTLCEEKNEKVMIEYSQPNTHKAFHVGHMRNVALGDALSRMYRACGYEVVAANYIGDVGAHIAKCLWVYINHFSGKVPDARKGEFLGSLYAKADELLDLGLLTKFPYPGLLVAEVKCISPHPAMENWKVVDLVAGDRRGRVVCAGLGYQVGDKVAWAYPGIAFAGRQVCDKDMKGVISQGAILSSKELGIGDDKNQIHLFGLAVASGELLTEVGRLADCGLSAGQRVAEVMAHRQREVSEILQKLESGDAELTRIWEETKAWSMADFHEIYDWLGAKFDHWFYESEVGEEGKRLVKQALTDGLLVESEGAVGADLAKDKLGFCMLLKSDGTGLYATKDIALAIRKFAEFGIQRSIYVVDFSQSLHFKQVFKTLEIMGWQQAQKCFHLAYGLVMVPEGKMSSRKGNVIVFSLLKDQLGQQLRVNFLEKYRGDWSDTEIADAERKLAVATIRYGMLNTDNLKNIVFDIADWTSPVGNTGPYLMYAYARTQSILRKVGQPETDKFKGELLNHPLERESMAALMHFKPIVHRACELNRPQSICLFLYELAKSFSRMYDQCPVKDAENLELQASRLMLVSAIGQALKAGLNMVGIETLERM